MTKQFILIASILGFIGVAIGAFGAHGLEDTLVENDREDTFQTASEYHMIHVFALITVAWISTQVDDKKYLRWAGNFFTAGTLIFSGSLYILAIFDLGFMGAVAPIGGVCLLMGWACLGWTAWKHMQT